MPRPVPSDLPNAPVTPGVGARARQCGRCRLFFEGDPTLPPDVLQDWWLCAPCHEALLGRSSSKPPRPLERAQVVWRAAVDSVASARPPDRMALDLLRVANHDVATMSHALAIGRSQLASNPNDLEIHEAAAVLDGAIGFLGARPERDTAP